MTGQSHVTLASAVITWGAYGLLIGAPVVIAVKCWLRDRREDREREAAEAVEQVRAMCACRCDPSPTWEDTPHAFAGPRRNPSFYECEAIWGETIAWGLAPDADLLDEFEMFAAALEREQS